MQYIIYQNFKIFGKLHHQLRGSDFQGGFPGGISEPLIGSEIEVRKWGLEKNSRTSFPDLDFRTSISEPKIGAEVQMYRAII